MDDDFPVPKKTNPLPTLGDAIAKWLGFQLPAIPMPQTLKNFDRAIGKIVLAAGENAEARIVANTCKAKAKGKISVEGLYRTEEERRKIENRTAIVQIAVDVINEGNKTGHTQDAESDIDDDWLNTFSRLAEDKSSEEIKSLFGKILAGEIRRPGSFSLRTLQFLSTLSKTDAQDISLFFSYVLSGHFVPLANELLSGPSVDLRILMEELGLASQPNMLGGIVKIITVPPNENVIIPAGVLGILIANQTAREIRFELECQLLAKPAQELMEIANPPPTDIEYLKSVSQIIFEKIRNAGHTEEIINARSVAVQVGQVTEAGRGRLRLIHAYTASIPS